MVHSSYASTAYATVMTHRWLHTIAFFTFFVQYFVEKINMLRVELPIITFIIRLPYVHELFQKNSHLAVFLLFHFYSSLFL